MVVVLVIAGLALTLVMTRGVPRSPGLEARLAASDVAQALRLARGRAIAGNRPVGFTLDVARHVWRVDGGQPQPLPADLSVALNVVASVSRGAGAEAGRIVFAPDGSSSGGTVELAAADTRLAVGVDWLTGRVAIARAP